MTSDIGSARALGPSLSRMTVGKCDSPVNLQARYPEHSFVHFTMNETDDVMGFSKWKWAFTRLTQSEAHRSEEDAVLLLALQMCTVTYFADFLDPLSRKLFTD